MKVLVTGANGFLGRHVVEALLRAGHAVRAFVRGPSTAAQLEPGLETVQGDLLDEAALGPALAGVDAVIHLALDMRARGDTLLRSAIEGTSHLVGAMPSGGPRLILASSFAVYDWRAVRGALSEDSPLLRVETAPLSGDYANAKLAQETLARTLCARRRIALTILRPATIWGAGHPGLELVGPGRGQLRLLMAPQRIAQSTYVENCAGAFVAALHDRSDLGVFNVEDGFATPVADFARAVRPGMRLVPVPAWMLAGLSTLGPLMRDARRRGVRVPGLLIPERLAARFPRVGVDTTRLRRDLGWTPRLDFSEAVKHSRR